MFANTELTLKIGSTMQSYRHITRVHIEMQEFAQRGLEALKWWVGQYEVGGVAPLEERKKERKAGVRFAVPTYNARWCPAHTGLECRPRHHGLESVQTLLDLTSG